LAENKKISLIVLLSIILTLSSFLPSFTFGVSANSSIIDKIENLKDERNEIKSDKKSKEGKLDEVRNKQRTVEEQIEYLDGQVAKTQVSIRNKETNITKTKAEIAKLQVQINELKEKIKKRNELLKDRARALQQNGGTINYLSVLLGAENFADFIGRVNAVSVIMGADKTIIEEQTNDQNSLEENEKTVQKNLQQLREDLSTLTNLKSDLVSQQNEKSVVMDELKKQGKAIEEEIITLAEQERILKAQERAARIELEEWKRRQQEQQNNGGNYPPVTSGDFMRPATGPVSSEYGPRWGKMHHGIDISKAGRADAPIVAAAPGTVIQSYYSSSYGNVIFVTHNIRGNVMTTVYAHLESRSVGEGQRVEKGQYLGEMGNTGQSFGAHLHFEIHEGPWNGAKSNSVNPRKYIGF
jgi:peptidoglycan hydrolase CwlO-like protein